jgi:uncharacterized protein YcfJ
MNIITILKPLAAAAALLAAGQAFAQVTFYEGEGFRGRAFAADRPIGNFADFGFNDRASSVVVDRGRWEVCEDAGFRGHCVVLRRGSYDSLRGLGLENRISSVRPVADRGRYENEAPQPLAAPTYEFRQRPSERLFEAPVVSARAVLGPPEQRCWTERQQVEERRDLNVPGGVIGGVLGGILGHQIGGGSGKTVATIGGAVAGGALGANVDRIRDPVSGRDVRRCENVANSGPPQYYDVIYNFHGIEHHVQMATPPGPTVAVNGRGEPRQ